MEPHDSHELALNRAFEERWQRRMERPRSVAALTALQYRERKKYELAWYKNETIQLSEQIEHLQNRLSFLMDQNTSLNLECQKLRKRVAQLENLCRDQLKNLVSRPSSKLVTSSSGNSESPSSSLVSGSVVISETIKGDISNDQNQEEVELEESGASSPPIPPADEPSGSVNSSSEAKSNVTNSLATTTATVRRGIPIVKQRSPSGKTTIVAAAASTSGALRSGSKHGSGNVSYVTLSSSKESQLVRAASPSQNVAEHDYLPRKRILIPKRALASASSDGNKGQALHVVRPISSVSSKPVSAGKHDSSALSSPYTEQRSSHSKSLGNVHGISSKKLSQNSFSKNIEFERRRKIRSVSPLKTPPEVIISDAESSDVEAQERLSKAQRYSHTLAIGEKHFVKSSNPKRSHFQDEKQVESSKRSKPDNDSRS